MVDGIQAPDIEIVVRVREADIALIAFFADGEGGFHCVAGVEDTGQVELIKHALEQSAVALAFAFASDAPVGTKGNVSRVEDGEGDHPF